MRISKERADELLRHKEMYLEAMGWDRVYQARELANWSLRKGLYRPDDRAEIDQATRDYAEALRYETHTDPSGARVRTNLAARTTVDNGNGRRKQEDLWGDMRTAPYEFVLQAFADLRTASQEDVEAIKRRMRSYNEHHLPRGRDPINLSFNFDDEDGFAAAGA